MGLFEPQHRHQDKDQHLQTETAAADMNIGFCAFILLATTTSGWSLSSQSVVAQSQRVEALASNSLTPPSPKHTRQARSVSPPGQMTHYNHVQQEGDTRDSLNQLLARLMPRKGVPFQTRSSLSSRSSGLGPGHRIKDRDYLGWMDFGRRSAEEYEYSS